MGSVTPAPISQFGNVDPRVACFFLIVMELVRDKGVEGKQRNKEFDGGEAVRQ